MFTHIEVIQEVSVLDKDIELEDHSSTMELIQNSDAEKEDTSKENG